MVETCEIGADVVNDYHAQGYAILRGVFTPDEMAEASREAAALFQRTDLIDTDNLRCRWQNHYQTGQCRFDTFDPVIDLSPLVECLARDPRILSALAAIYGEPARLFKDKLIYKPPGTVGYGLHQDYISWPTFPRSFVTVLVALDPTSDENGCTEVFPDRHRSGYLCEADGDYHELPLSAVDLSAGVKLELRPGDIAVFGCFTPHRSAPNRSTTWRRQLYLSYNAQSDGGDQRSAHYREFHAWLRKKYGEYGRHNVYFR